MSAPLSPGQSPAPAHKRKRISYVIPPATYALDILQLPPPLPLDHISFDARPRLFSARTGKRVPDAAQFVSAPGDTTPVEGGSSVFQTHPKHCLGISTLAVDLSTAVMPPENADTYFSSDPTPQGILYSGGRDGLIAAWELKLPTRQRKRRISSSRQTVEARIERWTELGIYDDNADAEEIPEDSDSSDSDDEDPFADHSERAARRISSNKMKNLAYEDRWQLDDSARNQTLEKTTFRQSVHSHSDWINSLVLCNMNQTVVTASSDQTIKAWNPHDTVDSMQPALIGTHDDYVKTLANSRHGGWVASGAFDRRIKLWDLGEVRDSPLVEFGPTSDISSIYALATNQSGTLIASGSPEKMVRIWDPRSNKPQISRLNGHADNVRAICMSEDSRCILTASADSTIKLWSLSMQRCVHTFTFHNESVWSLFSPHPNLETFYSGDKTGVVCKVDFEGCGDISDGQCVVLCKDDETTAKYGGAEGINAIVAVDNAYVWTATGGSSIQRWKDVDSLNNRRVSSQPATRFPFDNGLVPLAEDSPSSSPLISQPFYAPNTNNERRGVSFASAEPGSPTGQPRGPRPSFGTRASALRTASGSTAPISINPTTKIEDSEHGLPVESLVPLGSADVYAVGAALGRIESRLQTNGSMTSLPTAMNTSTTGRSSSMSFGYSGSSLTRFPSRQGDVSGTLDETLSAAFVAYTDRESCGDAVPLRLNPDDVIYGRKGLIRCVQLNDRRSVLTADTTGDIAVWDIVLCRCIGIFAKDDLAKQANHGNSHNQGKEIKALLEFVQERVEGTGSALQWAGVDVRVGSLSVHLDEGRCFNGETYVEESGLAGLFPDQVLRVNYVKIVLRNLFDAFIQAELRKPAQLTGAPSTTSAESQRLHRTLAPGHISLSGLDRPTNARPLLTSSIALATPAATGTVPPSDADRAARVFDRSLTALYQVKEAETESSLPSTAVPSPKTPVMRSVAPVTPGSNGFMNKFKLRNRKNTSDQAASTEAPALFTQKATVQTPIEAHQAALNEIFNQPLQPPGLEEAPRLKIPAGLVYAISEETRVSSAWSVTHRGLADNSGAEANTLEAKSPLWLLEFLLQSRSVPVEAQKLTFVLSPFKFSSDGGLPNMPLKLTANRLLRIAKVSAFIAEKLSLQHAQQQQQTAQPSPPRDANYFQNSGMKSPSHSSLNSSISTQSGRSVATSAPAFDPATIELICNDIPLPPNATLAGVRQVCFRKGGDLALLYRLRTT